MALTRAMLKGMGLTEEQVGAIIEEHLNTVDGLKADRDQYKKEAETLPKVQKELSDLKAAMENTDSNEWQNKYEQEHKNFEDYKAEVANKEKLEKVKSAYKALLEESKVGEKHISLIMRATDFSEMELDKDGNLVNADKLTEGIKSEWADYIVSDGEQGADVENPPSGGVAMTKEAYAKLSLSEQMAFANAHPAEAAEFLK